MTHVRHLARGNGESRLLAFPLRLVVALGILGAPPLAAWFPSTESPLAAPTAITGLALAAGDTAREATPFLTLVTREGEVLVDEPLPASRSWRLEWTHSVAQVAIVDVYAWRDGAIYVTDQFTPYLDIAGLGNFAGRGDLIELDDGGYHLANIDLPLHGNAHDMIIGSRRAPSVLVVGEDRFELSATHPATHARIEVDLR